MPDRLAEIAATDAAFMPESTSKGWVQLDVGLSGGSCEFGTAAVRVILHVLE
jgi:hypothetical protein